MPFVSEWVLIAYFRPPAPWRDISDLIEYISSIAIGCFFVFMLPAKLYVRIIIGMLYTPLVMWMLAYFTLIVICSEYHQCL